MPSAASAKVEKAPPQAAAVTNKMEQIVAAASAGQKQMSPPPTTQQTLVDASAAATANNIVAAGVPVVATTAAKQSVIVPEDPNSPVRQALVIIEHKIRNLEKRKGKLESYRDLQNSGKDLSAEQKVAVSKYDEVAQQLELARDIAKQFMQIAAASEKEQKKQQRRQAVQRAQAETVKLREVFIINDNLSKLCGGSDEVRDDFLTGSNGACKLEEAEMEMLDKFFVDITPKQPHSGSDLVFAKSAQKSAEHLSLAIDGRGKFYQENITYDDVRKILQRINEAAYFEPKFAVDEPVVDVDVPVDEANSEMGVSEENGISSNHNEPSMNHMKSDQAVDEYADQMSVAVNMQHEFQEALQSAVSTPAFPPQLPQQQQQQPQPVTHQQQPPQAQPPQMQPPQQQQQQLPPQQPPMMGTGGAPSQLLGQPTTVRAVEQAYFKQQHQYIQQMRPLADVIGTGSFFFLQESELDSPDIMPGVPNVLFPQPLSSPIPQPQQQQPQQTQQQPSVPPQLQQQQPPNMSSVNQQQQQTPVVGIHSSNLANLSQQQPPNAPAAIPSQTFTNPQFPNITPQPIFPGQENVVVVQQPQAQLQSQQQQPLQSHIPGFSSVNAPIPMPIVQQQILQTPQSLGTQQHLQQQPGQAGSIMAPPMPGFPTTGKFVAGNVMGVSSTMGVPPQQQQQQPQTHQSMNLSQQSQPPRHSSPPKDRRHESHHLHHHSSNAPETDDNQKIPEIGEWNKIVDSSSGGSGGGGVGQNQPDWETDNKQESNDWNGTVGTFGADDKDQYQESNTWSNDQAYGNRSNRYGTRGPNNRGPPRSGNGPPSNGGYRGSRPNTGSYPNGRNSGGGGGGTFYRNNDNYYQNQNGGGGFNNRGGNSNKDDIGGYRGGNAGNSSYRSRDNGQNSMRSGGMHSRHAGGGGSTERQSQPSQSQQQPQPPRTTSNRNPMMGGGNGGSGAGGGGGVRPNRSGPSNGNSTGYSGGGQRNPGTRSSHPQQGVNA